MRAFLDTSVLVAAFYGDHEHHDSSIELFLRYRKHEACCAAHSLAEVYASLTGMPGKNRATPDEARAVAVRLHSLLRSLGYDLATVSAEVQGDQIVVEVDEGQLGELLFEAHANGA